jgi:uncharacterized coiled-coil DUF342 family protein
MQGCECPNSHPHLLFSFEAKPQAKESANTVSADGESIVRLEEEITALRKEVSDFHKEVSDLKQQFAQFKKQFE